MNHEETHNPGGKVILTIEVESVEELRQKVCDLAHAFGISTGAGTTLPVLERQEVADTANYELVDAPPSPTKNDTQEPSEKPRRGRKKKEVVDPTPEASDTALEASQEVEVSEPEAAAFESSTQPPPTKDDAVAALSKVNSKFGLNKAREILSRFGCTRISEVAEKHYPEFIKLCNEAVKA